MKSNFIKTSNKITLHNFHLLYLGYTVTLYIGLNILTNY